MTDTTQPDPQVVAWMRRHMRDNPGADGAVALLAYLQRYEGALELLPDRDMLLASARAANKPLTLTDIPAGQGPASLYVEGDVVCYRCRSGMPVIAYRRKPAWASNGEDFALWKHLAATLRHVTTEEES